MCLLLRTCFSVQFLRASNQCKPLHYPIFFSPFWQVTDFTAFADLPEIDFSWSCWARGACEAGNGAENGNKKSISKSLSSRLVPIQLIISSISR